MYDVGDRVQRVKDISRKGTVVSKSVNFWNVFQAKWDNGEYACVSANDIELVSDSPVREVTRREIVESRYGMVEVGKQHKSLVSIRIANRNGDLRNCTVEELREAAHILNQIAEALADASN